MNSLGSERVNQLDGLRVFAILGVILVHTTTRVLERTSYNLDLYYLTLLLNQYARFAVPLFFLISGFALEFANPGKLNIIKYIKKRLSRILIPYIFWSFIYYYFIYTTNPENFIRTLLTGDASYQLYFIPSLIIFYFLFPLLHKFYKYISTPAILMTLTILQIWILKNDYFVRNLQYTDAIRISILGFFFFLVGIVTAHYKEMLVSISKRWRYVLGIIFFASGYYIFHEGISQYYITYNINAFYSSWRPSTLLYTLVSGLFLLSLLDKVNFHKLSRLSFLVFFIHVFILEIIWKLIGKYVSPSFYFDLLFFILVTAVSFSLAFIAHKIPRVSKVLG